MTIPWFSDTGGPGRPLVLLHAFPLSSTIYDRLVDTLAGEPRTIRVDLPGLGRSAGSGEPSMEAMADAVLAVLDHLDLRSATVMGTSTGGYVGLEIARTAPERLDALVVASSTSRITEPDVPAERRDLADRLEAAGRDGLVDLLGPLAEDGLGPTARDSQPELQPMLLDVVRAASPEGVAWAARAVAARHDTSAALAALAAPVLLLFGAEDDATPAALADELAALRPGLPTQVRVLEQTGHLTALERPAAVAAELRAFLAQVPAGAHR